MYVLNYYFGAFLCWAGIFAAADKEDTLAFRFFVMGLLLIINGTLVQILKQLRNGKGK